MLVCIETIVRIRIHRTREHDSQNRAGIRGTFDAEFPTVFLDYLVSDSESQASSICFATTGEGTEDLVANRFGNTRPVVGDAETHFVVRFLHGDVDMSRVWAHGLESIEQQIVKDAFKLSGVEPAITLAVSRNSDRHSLRSGS